HFQVPAIRHVTHAKAIQHVAADRAKWREIAEARAVNEAQQKAADASGHDLLRRQAAALTRATRAGAENEDGLPRGDRRDQVGDEFGRIAAVAIEKDENVGVLSYGGNARLDGAPVTASRLDDDTGRGRRSTGEPRGDDGPGRGRGCTVDRAVPRAAVHDNDLAHVLRQHGAHDRCNGRFLVEAWNDRRHDGLAVDIGPRRIALARDVAHRLQRSPQLAQAAGGSPDSRALRKSRYAGPFQMSRKVCCVALPKVYLS